MSVPFRVIEPATTEPPESEKAVLCSIIRDARFAMPLCAMLDPKAFANPVNRGIFYALLEMWNDSKPIELVSVTQYLRDSGRLDSCGGAGYITEVADFVPTAHVVEYYLGQMRERYVIRQLQSAGTQMAATSATANATEAVADAQKLLADISRQSITTRVCKTLGELVQDKMARMEQGRESEYMVPTGITKLDKLSPIRRGDMPLLMAERKLGKSIIALNVALNAARSNVPVLLFSLEDGAPKIIDRLFSAVARIPMDDCRSASQLNEDQLRRATFAGEEISRLRIFIRDDCYDLAEIISATREMKTRQGIGLAIVDYAQLVRAPREGKESNREQTIAAVSRAFRLLAMELETPILLLSQVNEFGRARESRALENDATALWQITHGDEESPNVRYIEIPAQRNGPSGITFPVTFLGGMARIENYAESEGFHE